MPPEPTRERVADHFAALAGRYDDTAFGASLGLQAISSAELEATFAGIDEAPGTSVLDAGVGTGRLAAALADRQARVVGIDQSTEMLDQCRARLADAVPLARAAVGPALPFRSGVFDAVICMRVIKYVPSWPEALAELARVLRADGVLVLEVANARSLARWGYGGFGVRLATYAETRLLLRQAGFSVERLVPGTRLPFAAYRWATTQRRVGLLRRIERGAAAVVGPRALARSFVVLARRA